jgi:hypothetical protein
VYQRQRYISFLVASFVLLYQITLSSYATLELAHEVVSRFLPNFASRGHLMGPSVVRGFHLP